MPASNSSKNSSAERNEKGRSSRNKKTYVLDTSVLLADPQALKRFAEHEVIIPIAVIGELETKRDHPELGFFARGALRALDELRISNGRLDQPIQITQEGGTLSVELNHTDLSALPQGFLRDGTNDSRILAIAKNLMRSEEHTSELQSH